MNKYLLTLLLQFMLVALVTSQSDTADIFMPEVISTPLNERDLAISNGGDTIIYTVGTTDNKHRGLFLVKRVNGEWSDHQLLPFSGTYHDIEPFFTPDGGQLLFASNRPIYGDSMRKDYNLWYIDLSDGVWGKPVPFDSTINTRGQEYFPSMSRNRNLYYTATREYGYGLEDIYVSQWQGNQYKVGMALDTNVNSRNYEFNAYISPDEDLLLFSSFGRTDGHGGGDLYYSLRDDSGQWSKAVNLGGAINSASLDYCPFFDVENNLLYFTSNRSKNLDVLRQYRDIYLYDSGIFNGSGNIYFVKFDPK